MRSQGIGLALVRIAFGVYFLLSAYQKTAEGWFASGGSMAGSIGQRLPQSDAFYRPFLEATVLPNADTFAKLIVLGEWGVGLSLVLGALTAVGAGVGALLMLNYIFLKGIANFAAFIGGTDWLFLLGFIALLIGAAGMVFGVDGLLFRRRRPRAVAATTAERLAVSAGTTPISRRTMTRATDAT